MNILDQRTTTTLTVSFQPIPCGSRKGAISYDVELLVFANNQREINAQFNFVNSNNLVTVTISGLQYGTFYTFKVRGVTGGGGTLHGPFSEPYTVETATGKLNILVVFDFCINTLR